MHRAESPKTQHRRRIFEQFSQNLASFEEDGLQIQATERETGKTSIASTHKFYVCPLCLKPRHKELLTQSPDGSADPWLTIEDVPPKQSSKDLPKLKLVTCKPCNNMAGTKLENDLRRDLHLKDAMVGEAHDPVAVKVQMGDISVSGDLARGSDRNVKLYLPNAEAPQDPRSRFWQEIEALADQGDKATFNITFDLPNDRHVWVAMLKTAYLIAFSYFGYGFAIFHPTIGRVRKQIALPDQNIVPRQAFANVSGLADHVTVPGIWFIADPPSILVTFKLRYDGEVHERGVLLPGMTDDQVQLYDHLPKIPHEQLQLKVLDGVDDREWKGRPLIKNPEDRHAIYHWWHELYG